MRLTFEETRGTRTVYFPLEKSSDFPADFTVMVRPVCEHGFTGEDAFSAGVAFCNPEDQFSKRRGRVIAYHRMRINGPPGINGSALFIIDTIMAKMQEINMRRWFSDYGQVLSNSVYVPDMDEGAIRDDLHKVLSFEALSEYFTEKDANRGEQRALEA